MSMADITFSGSLKVRLRSRRCAAKGLRWAARRTKQDARRKCDGILLTQVKMNAIKQCRMALAQDGGHVEDFLEPGKFSDMAEFEEPGIRCPFGAAASACWYCD